MKAAAHKGLPHTILSAVVGQILPGITSASSASVDRTPRGGGRCFATGSTRHRQWHPKTTYKRNTPTFHRQSNALKFPVWL